MVYIGIIASVVTAAFLLVGAFFLIVPIFAEPSNKQRFAGLLLMLTAGSLIYWVSTHITITQGG